MAVKTFTDNTGLPASDINLYLANAGLVYITGQAIGSAAPSVTVSNCFSSAYDNYRIICTGGIASTTVNIRLSLAGITTGYYGGFAGTSYTASTFYGQNDNNGPHWSWIGFGSTGSSLFDCDITNPFTSGARKYINARNMYISAGNAYGTYVGETVGTTSATGFTITPSTGTLTGGTIRVYGYRQA